MKLTARKVKSLNPKEKPYKESDGKGLFLLVNPNGSKYWRLKYYLAGKEKLLSVGVYPDVSLKQAREECSKARELINKGINPAQYRKDKKILDQQSQVNTFKAISLEWIEKQNSKWSDSSKTKIVKCLEKNLFPVIGHKPINDISTTLLLQVIRQIEARGVHSVVRKALQLSINIFRYAVITHRCTYNPAQDLTGALMVAPPVKHRLALSEEQLPTFFTALNQSDNLQNIIAIKLQFYTLARPVEINAAVWSEFDLEKAVWTIPADRMKMKREHKMPLPVQAVEILKQLHIMNGAFKHLFINRNDHRRPISKNTLNSFIKRLGFDATSHGIRSTGSTILNEQGFNPDCIERQLAHQDKNAIRKAYNRAQYWSERVIMMQKWADYLDDIQKS